MRKITLFLTCLFTVNSIACFSQTQALNQLVYTIRDPQTKASDFREALEKIGNQLGNLVLEDLEKQEVSVTTLTGEKATHFLVNETPVLITILRAGLPLNAGVQKVFPESPVGFLAMSRNEETVKAQCDYIALPEITDKVVIIVDTMLATGGSILDMIQFIEPFHPKKIILINAIAAKPGIERILNHNSEVKIYAAVVDDKLNEKGYILPGLGDAGDRAYGEKVYKTN